MKPFLLVGSVVCILTFTGLASGQVPSQPSSSFNYLNLTRGGNSAVNYYGIVRPNAFNQNALMNMQQDYQSLTQSSTQNDPNAMRTTGHAAGFMNYGHYYPRLNTGGGRQTGMPTRR
jgi:hypothetical protein